jgi:sulfur carrier protein
MVILKTIFINGLKYETSASVNISEVLCYFNCKKKFFILEYNSLVYDSKYWSKIKIKNNDKIEIITIVGGG